MKEFEHYVKKGDVKKQKPDGLVSQAVFRDAIDRLAHAKSILKSAKAKYVLENAYESMREAADALLYNDGYKSCSHEASIVYLVGKGFTAHELGEFDRFRKIRNDIKCYGGDCDDTDAKQYIALAEQIINKIRLLLQKQSTQGNQTGGG